MNSNYTAATDASSNQLIPAASNHFIYVFSTHRFSAVTVYFGILLLSLFGSTASAQDTSRTESILLDSSRIFDRRGSIEGQVIDRNTRQEIIGARVELLGTSRGAVTDARGNFLITDLLPATYRLKISATDYKTAVKTDIAVSSAQNTKLVVELKLDSYQSDEVVVISAKPFDRSDDQRVSANALSREEVRRAPGALEDVSRMVQSLPGVTSNNDGANDIIARGGNPVENFTMIDGIEVANINHYSSQGTSGGAIGMINVDFLQDVNFSTGGFGVKYGDRLSSLMDLSYRDGDKRSTHGKMDFGLAGIGGIIETPIQEGKSSILFSARKSYVDLLFKVLGYSNTPSYTNFNLKATYELSPAHRLSVIGLGGIESDRFRSAEEDSLVGTEADYEGWQAVVGVSHQWLLDKNTLLRTSLSGSSYTYKSRQDSAASVRKDAIPNAVAEARDREWILRTDFSHRLSSADLIEIGGTLRRPDTRNIASVPEFSDGFGNSRLLTLDNFLSATKAGFYAQYTKNIGRLGITAGARYDYFSFINTPHAVSPRLSASYELTNSLRVNAAVGLYQQAPPLLWLMTGDNTGQDAKFMKAVHTIAGIEYFPVEDVKISVEVYNKAYSDYLNSLTNLYYTYANQNGNISAAYEPVSPSSTGAARGIELFVHKKLTERFYAMISYSLSEVRFRSLDGVERPSTFDTRQSATAIAGYKLTAGLELSVKWRFTGGRPDTPLDEVESAAQGKTVLDATRFNAVRLPSYNRLDVRLDQRFSLFGLTAVGYLDLQNIYDQRNVQTVVWNNKTRAPESVYQFGFLPTFGLKLEF